MTGSKFAGLRAMREQRAAAAEPEPAGPEPEVAVAVPVAVGSGVGKRKVGRPPGKRSDPSYQQVTVLLHGQTYLEVRKRLLDERKEVSDLLNELLSEWLKS